MMFTIGFKGLAVRCVIASLIPLTQLIVAGQWNRWGAFIIGIILWVIFYHFANRPYDFLGEREV